MKLRNQLLALCCLLVFAAFGFLYVRNWVAPKTFGIILFVSDGMVARQITAARLYEGGADHRLTLESFPNLALLRNPARDFAVPDAAAAATALATGTRVGHRQLAVDAAGKPIASLLELARQQGRAVGLITMDSPLAPTPAAFYAHLPDARDSAQVLQQFLDRGNLDVLMCGGAGEFLPAAKGGHRKDGRDILSELQTKGWEMVRTKAELENSASYQSGPFAGFFSDGALAFSNQFESGSQQPSLADMVRRSIEFLQTHGKGYVLVVDASLATVAAERNEGERLISETLALDHAIATAMKYAGDKSLILSVGKHAVGGFSLNGYPFVQDHGVGLLGVNAAGQPAITWATGPNGPSGKTEPSAFQTPSALNTAEDVMAVGQGAGSERLRGFLDNTEIFKILKDAL
ncbi:Alkaline phosphatase [Chthoniobacter flavus Ellin428]|uniref:Alkaline phosphatase n=1 Tax=Chthoniobacter flavus Ellin428 TaxID=497964 RepID=B4D3K1_9BACT|nr:alkaline phosphatase [Chthoniobacter flavus]EDY18831.1 Alkaline phosphatase [Chthoniobacter flavus Ellin428]TCO93429.1 alkaline phosphatase [Chthoniobacter flavus]